MTVIVVGGASFLLAVLWFDLMFDVQVRGHDGVELPEPVLASIASYYRRVTTDAAPMNRFVALGMVATLAGIVGQAAAGETGWPWLVASALLAVPPIALAGARVVPAAVRLGTRVDEPVEQSRLARQIFRDHVFCFTSIGFLVAAQAVAAAVR
ncbi:MAG TPA: hypothetical protein VFU14_16175 [Acidimicrobiales bacterium]|nr:hypothetical protein [Acidimicrobiales bacterium]